MIFSEEAGHSSLLQDLQAMDRQLDQDRETNKNKTIQKQNKQKRGEGRGSRLDTRS